MVLDVTKWALFENISLPFGVISDAISYVYNEGRTDIAFDMYRNIYEHGLIQHWSCADALEIDLHKFSRGMAYSAIRCAFDEILQSRKWLNMPKVPLTVITGKNMKPRDSSALSVAATISNSEFEFDTSKPYRVSQEIQNMLVEDFFPPVSSSTYPGNTGRLLVNIEDIQSTMKRT